MTQISAVTIWFAGMPRTGQTTLAGRLEGEIRARDFPVEVLDGDLMLSLLSEGWVYKARPR
jgi:adenylylsulfate kinase